ncbi:MAG: nucleoside 2-deoxyribosyltransferase [Nitrososphaeria archaeon]|nr:nucleoside 2-deoxyribosyltransferase [Nitrososphaeria archaeon]
MKILVCGPIAYGGIERIRWLQKILAQELFEVIDQFQSKEMDYSNVKDFRDNKKLAKTIVSNDFSFIEKSDLIVAICDQPSFGTAIEIYYAKMLGKSVIVLNEAEQPSPWPIAFADIIVKDVNSLLKVLKKLAFKMNQV